MGSSVSVYSTLVLKRFANFYLKNGLFDLDVATKNKTRCKSGFLSRLPKTAEKYDYRKSIFTT